MQDGYAPSWGVETPVRTNVCRFLGAPKSLAFAVGEPVAYVQAPKAKGYGDRVLTGFSNSPTSGSKGCLRGRTADVFPSPVEESWCLLPKLGQFLIPMQGRSVLH